MLSAQDSQGLMPPASIFQKMVARLFFHHSCLTLPGLSDSCSSSTVPSVAGKLAVVAEPILKETYSLPRLVLLLIHQWASLYGHSTQPSPVRPVTGQARWSSREEMTHHAPIPASVLTFGAGYTGDYHHRQW